MPCDYGDAAQNAYTTMVKCFQDPKCSDYWKLGNAFDSMTDYLRWWGGPDTALPGIVYDRYQTLVNPPNSWNRSDCGALDPEGRANADDSKSNPSA